MGCGAECRFSTRKDGCCTTSAIKARRRESSSYLRDCSSIITIRFLWWIPLTGEYRCSVISDCPSRRRERSDEEGATGLRVADAWDELRPGTTQQRCFG